MLIRIATPQDLPAIREIWNHYILHSTYNYDSEPKSAAFMASWYEKKQVTGIPIFVVEAEGQLAGYGSYSQFREREGYRHSAEHGLYFKSSFQGKGMGKQLLEHILADGKSRNFHTFIAVIDSSNEGSIVFHEKMGFERIGLMKEVGTKNGEWLSLVFLQKII